MAGQRSGRAGGLAGAALREPLSVQGREGAANDARDDWLRDYALASQRMDSARTFLLVQQGHILGYFSLTMGSVLRSDAPRQLVRGLPAYPIGVALLARLAVDLHHQGGASVVSCLLKRCA